MTVNPATVSPYTAELFGANGRTQERLWAAAFASHAIRAIGTRGAAAAAGCLDTASCRQPDRPLVSNQAANLGPVCVLCALDSAVERYVSPVTTPAAEAARSLYRAAKIAVAEVALRDLGTACADTARTIHVLQSLAASLRAPNKEGTEQ